MESQQTDKSRCRASIRDWKSSGVLRQCSFKPKPGKEWCQVHDLDAVLRRREKSKARLAAARKEASARALDARLAKRDRRTFQPEAWDRCVEALCDLIGPFPEGVTKDFLRSLLARHARLIVDGD